MGDSLHVHLLSLVTIWTIPHPRNHLLDPKSKTKIPPPRPSTIYWEPNRCLPLTSYHLHNSPRLGATHNRSLIQGLFRWMSQTRNKLHFSFLFYGLFVEMKIMLAATFTAPHGMSKMVLGLFCGSSQFHLRATPAGGCPLSTLQKRTWRFWGVRDLAKVTWGKAAEPQQNRRSFPPATGRWLPAKHLPQWGVHLSS